IDVPPLRPRADDERRDAEPVTGGIHFGRNDMVVEAAPVVPCEEDRGARPVRASHNRVDHVSDPRLPGADQGSWMLGVPEVGLNPGNRRKISLLRGSREAVDALDVPDLTVLTHGREARERVPDARRADALQLWH